ncbi:MAG: hypothetical protein M1608_08925 [Candidatus Omnitrophica bacterium]|nr:hypothetical protein [Candidatus Omnitrophota bacterium]
MNLKLNDASTEYLSMNKPQINVPFVNLLAKMAVFALCCTSISLAETSVNSAIALHYVDSWEGAVVESTSHNDGSMDAVIKATGIADRLGKISADINIHIGAPVLVDFKNKRSAFILPWVGSSTIHFEEGDWFTDDFRGATVVPLDKTGQPLPPPYYGTGVWIITDGIGRFTGATGSGITKGIDYETGAYAGQNSGMIWLRKPHN